MNGKGFSGEGKALTLAAPSNEPDADKSLASLAEVHSSSVVVAVGLSPARTLGWTVGKLGLDELHPYTTLGVGNKERCSGV